MKRKLIVTLVASALEIYAASAMAQSAGTCALPAGANAFSGATPISTGPLNPTNGFPEWVQDSNGLRLQRCVDPDRCFFDPVVTTDPFSLQIGTGGEAFYWSADAVLDDAAGNRVLTLVMAAETAFLEEGPNAEPINGSQFAFLRLRFVMGVPVDGTYTVQHPYGVNVFTVTGATGQRDVAATVDVGYPPDSSSTLGPVGPFLVAAGAPAGFVGDMGPAGVATTVTGSPCGYNNVRVTGVDTLGNPVVFGGGVTVIETNQFAVQGQLFDNRLHTPINNTRNTYSRTASNGVIEAFATSTPGAVVTVQDGPTIPAGTSRIADPVALENATFGTDGVNSAGVAVADASALPPIVTLTASATAGAPATDATALNLKLVDFVDVTSATYDPATGNLTVVAQSGDQRTPPTLTLRDFGAFDAGVGSKTVATLAPPAVVHVDSSAGGSASAQVVVAAAAAPSAPIVSVSAKGATTLTLGWADVGPGELGYRIYSVVGNARTLVTTLGANATSYQATNLQPLTSYTYQVEAFNGAGEAASLSVTDTTLALPVAASAVGVALAAQQLTLTVNWTDNAGDETGYEIQRCVGTATFCATAANYVVVGQVGAGVTTFDDANATVNAGHVYRVVTLRGIDRAATAAQSARFVTPNRPLASGTPVASGITANSVTLTWTDNTGTGTRAETSYQLERRVGTTGNFLPVGAALAANTLSTTDSTAAAGTTYQYRVVGSNWAGGTASAAVTATTLTVPVDLFAVTNLGSASAIANPPSITWGDATTGETAYRVRRRTITLAANTGVRTPAAGTVTSFATVATLPAGSQTYTSGALTGNTMYEYEVVAMNGTTAGPATTTLVVPGGIAGIAVAPTAAVNNGLNRVTLTFNTVPQLAVGGYRIDRCEVVGAETCAEGSAGWTQVGTVAGRRNTTTTTFQHNGVTASVPAKSYRYRVVTTTGTSAVTTVTGTPSPTVTVNR